MGTRLELHEKLCTFLDSRNVYFQPPESIKMIYPCIVYELDGINNPYANNMHYVYHHQYSITLIARERYSELIDRFLEVFKNASFNRSFVSGNLYHFVYTLYF